MGKGDFTLFSCMSGESSPVFQPGLLAMVYGVSRVLQAARAAR